MASGKRKYRQSRIPAEWQNRPDRGGQVKRSATTFALYSSHHQVGERQRAANRRNRFQQSETGIGVRRVIPYRLAAENWFRAGPLLSKFLSMRARKFIRRIFFRARASSRLT